MKSDQKKNKASVAALIQQRALQQIDKALEYLTAPPPNIDEAIHETRRCLKRVRAILRLVRTELGETTFDRDNIYFRNVGRRLAPLRDAAVMTETFANLKKQFAQRLPNQAWREIKQELAAVHRQPVQSKRKVMTAVALRLRTARARVEKWGLEFADEAVLQNGLRQAYQRGSRAMEQALEDPTAENFHEWRKQVNHLRHQLQILREMKIGKVKAALRDFKALAAKLGHNNDLAVLARQLQRIKQPAGEPDKQVLQELIDAQTTAIKAAAAQLGEQLYARKSKAFIRQIRP